MFNRNFKSNILLITYAAILVAFFIRIDSVMFVTKRVFGVMMPFIYALILAYIINWPYSFFVEKVKSLRFKKTIALFFSYALVAGIITFLICIIMPQIVSSIKKIITMITEYSPNFEKWITDNIPNSSSLKQVIEKFLDKCDVYVENAFTSVFVFTKEFAISVYNWIIGFIISIYLLSSKEMLIGFVKRISAAYLSKSLNEGLLEVFALLHNVFGRFLKGKIIDSFIVGVLCFIGMIILRMPFAVLISVIVGVTNIIPFFGPFFGAIPSVLIMFVVDSHKAIWLAIFILILQQLDGNVIGPKVLGDSVGISGVFIIFSVILGGGLFGVTGMILGVPIFAAVYVIIGRLVKKKESRISSET